MSGFISLDCGRLPINHSYAEPSTGIIYVSDAAYVASGESKSVEPRYSEVSQEQAAFVRTFTDGGPRHCYSIGVARDARYLIRASFLYGNYDGLNRLPQFDIHVGVSLWETITIEAVGLNVIKDVVHVATREVLSVCLVDTGSGTPFISALELRPLKNDTYVTPSGSLSLYLRGDVGSTLNGSIYRYGLNYV